MIPITVMCAWDSLTIGGLSPDRPNGHRPYTASLLNDAGVKATYVGRTDDGVLYPGTPDEILLRYERGPSPSPTTLTMLEQVPAIFAANPAPDFLLLTIGTNDLLYDHVDAATLTGRVVALLDAINDASPSTRVLLMAQQTVTPGGSTAYLPTIEAYNDGLVDAVGARARVVRLGWKAGVLHTDGIHPNHFGHDQMSNMFSFAVLHWLDYPGAGPLVVSGTGTLAVTFGGVTYAVHDMTLVRVT